MSHVAVGSHAARFVRRPSEFELSTVPPSEADVYETEKEPFPGSAPNGSTLLGMLGEKHTDGPLQRGMRVALDGLSYTVMNRARRGEKLLLLDGVNALFQPASMAAIMGPSGSGKTTLLDLLAGRKTQGGESGRILFAGQKPSRPFLKRFTGYVEQFDTLLAELTVREMLMYTAELKRSVHEPKAVKQGHVEHLMEVLGLQRCADTQIGDVLSRGISGGQSKRTNIGIALISDPSVLFLDEPTSGLDSYTAHKVMKVVKRLEREGITICATIHCPSIETFRLFEQVLLLQQGRVVYHGSNGDHIMTYFAESFPELRRKADGENLAEWLVEITATPDMDVAQSFASTYDRSQLKVGNDVRMLASIKGDDAGISAEVLQHLAVKSSQATPMWKGLCTMLTYRTRNNYTNWVFLLGRVFDKLVFSLLTVVYYWKVGRDFSPSNAPNLAGVLFLWVVMPAYGAGPYLPAIVLERPVYVREMSDGLYTPFTYLLYKMVEELFLALVMSLVFAIPAWYLCLFAGNFAVFWLAWLLSLADGIAFAYATAALSPSMDVANAMFLTVPGMMLFACGYLIRYHDIKIWLKWSTWLTWMWYQWGALMINQFKGRNVVVFGNGGTGTGTEVLEYYSLNEENEWAFLGYSTIFFAAFIGMTYLALVHVQHQKR